MKKQKKAYYLPLLVDPLTGRSALYCIPNEGLRLALLLTHAKEVCDRVSDASWPTKEGEILIDAVCYHG